MEKPMATRRADRTPPCHVGSEAGFSLVEMLVAMTITLIISGAIYGLLSTGQSAFRREPELTDRQQNARIAMNLIMRDIANAGGGMPPFIQSFKNGLNAVAAAPVNADNVHTDELELITNSGSKDNEPVCYTSGNGNGSNLRLMRDLCEPSGCPSGTEFPVPQIVMLVMDDGTWSMRTILSVQPSNGNPGPGTCTSGSPHAVLSFASGTDDTGLNQPSGTCLASPGPGTTTNNNCGVQAISFATIVRYRIRNDAAGVPLLQRFSSDDPKSFVGHVMVDDGYQTVARGIEDLQVQYTRSGAATTWVDDAPVVTLNDYTTLINQVKVTLVARSEARNIQGARLNTATGRVNIRGSLTSVGSPRSTLIQLANAPASPSPKPWF